MTSLELVDPLWVALQQLALPEGAPQLNIDDLRVSEHAVLRYRQRVDALPRGHARRRLEQLVPDTQWQTLPRDWMLIMFRSGTYYGYPSHRPDVCLLEREGFVVTVLSQRFLRHCSPYSGRRGSQRISFSR